MGETQRPPDPAIKAQSAAKLMTSSGKAAESAPVNTLGEGGTKPFQMAGQVLAEGLPAKPTGPVESVPGGNAQNVPATYPKTAGSRAPTQGSAPAKRPMGRVKTR